MKLDYQPLEKAVQSLEKALERAQHEREDTELRDAVIQRFEYTYELSLKMLRRQLEQESDHPEAVDALAFKDLLREALEKGVALDLPRWVSYREARNISAHTYDEQKAHRVYQAALLFLPDAKGLLNELRLRTHDSP